MAIDRKELFKKLSKGASKEAPEPDAIEGESDEGDEYAADDGLKQKLLDAVTAAIESCFAK